MFTRGQVEWAIAQATDRTQGPGGEPRHDLKMKVKRLLDLDRKKGIDAAKPGRNSVASPFSRAGCQARDSQSPTPHTTRLRCSSACVC